MKLKFIGTNGSMGLTHGKVYDVDIGYDNNYEHGYAMATKEYYVQWNDAFGKRRCPYSSFDKLLENWESPGEDVNMKNLYRMDNVEKKLLEYVEEKRQLAEEQRVEDLYAEAIKAMGSYMGDKSEPEPTPAKRQELDIQAIIDDAMKNKDRYVCIYVTNEGMSVNIYPHTEEELCWIFDVNRGVYICPDCGEKVKMAR